MTALQTKLKELLHLNAETEWVEFKHNNDNPLLIGEYISALANGAALHHQPFGYLVWGIEDGTHRVIGTSFQPKQAKVKQEELENWLLRQLNPRVDVAMHSFEMDGLPVAMLEIQAARTAPVSFKDERYIRVGSYKQKLHDFPEKERKLWQILSAEQQDWSAQIVEDATLADLDTQALNFARAQYQEKHPQLASEAAGWDELTFLNKARLCVNDKLTNTALLLLGKDESSHWLLPAYAQITWVLRDERNLEKDYQHFGPPFLIASEQVRAKIRNLTVRHLPNDTLFPIEITQYDPWVLRECLHNCFAHQDYRLRGRINVVESPDSVLFTNLGSFIPGTVEETIRHDAPTEYQRNPLLAQAMVNLNMIDTIGSGIKRMFTLQRKRYFPMPDYDLREPERVTVRVHGRILDENYTNLLLRDTELELLDAIALDKVQKKRALSDEEFTRLKRQKLIEGRRPNLFVSAKIATVLEEKAAYIKNRAFDKAHYKEMVLAYLTQFGEATRQELDDLLLEKLSDTLNAEQKKKFINNLLQEMKKAEQITVEGATRWGKWRLPKPASDSPN